MTLRRAHCWILRPLDLLRPSFSLRNRKRKLAGRLDWVRALRRQQEKSCWAPAARQGACTGTSTPGTHSGRALSLGNRLWSTGNTQVAGGSKPRKSPVCQWSEHQFQRTLMRSGTAVVVNQRHSSGRRGLAGRMSRLPDKSARGPPPVGKLCQRGFFFLFFLFSIPGGWDFFKGLCPGPWGSLSLACFPLPPHQKVLLLCF